MNSLISPDDHWVIWTFLVGMAFLSLFLEQKYRILQENSPVQPLLSVQECWYPILD